MKKDNYSVNRIDELEDQRFEKLCEQVNGIHKMMVGNGQPGLIRTVAKNSAKIKIIITILTILLTACVGGTLYKTQSEESKESISNKQIEQIQQISPLMVELNKIDDTYTKQ